MQLNLHQTHHEIGDFESIFNYITKTFQSGQLRGLHVFPELFLTGYPLQDLVLQKSFIEDYQAFLDDLSAWSIKQLKSPENQSLALLMGGLNYQFDARGAPSNIENVVYLVEPKKPIKTIYTKQLLPNYDLYEEKKYFTPGSNVGVLNFNNKKIGILVCEDMWFSHLHEIDPVEQLKNYFEENKSKCDLIVNLSGSPFHLGKMEQRINRALEISQYLEAPFAYVNRVGAEDEIIFDGRSFLVDGTSCISVGKAFSADYLSLNWPTYTAPEKEKMRTLTIDANSWGTIFNIRLSLDTLKLNQLTDFECQEIIDAIVLGLSDYSLKNNVRKFTIALSGGLDSSLVLALLKILKDRKTFAFEIEAVFMPGFFSSSLSYDLAYDLCQNLGIKLTSFPIKFIHSTIKNLYKDSFQSILDGLADENIQSRIRGLIIYSRSNQHGSMILNTSNKSELAVGYSTLYGDSVGALSILGDLYKTEIFELAEYINRQYGNIIPSDIITRPPSAELRENQEDSQSLPPYERLDPILEAFLSYRFTPNDLIKKGHNSNEVLKVNQLIINSEYKRKQFCPIIKLKPKSFGFGYRVPISKKI